MTTKTATLKSSTSGNSILSAIGALMRSAVAKAKTNDAAGAESDITAAEALAAVNARADDADEDDDKKKKKAETDDEDEEDDDKKKKAKSEDDDEEEDDDKKKNAKSEDALAKFMRTTDAKFAGIEALLKEIVAKGSAKTETVDASVIAEIKQEVPAGTTDAAMLADSVPMLASFQETISMAEIIAPGLRAPVFERTDSPQKTFDAICGHRRAALTAGLANAQTNMFISAKIGGKTIDKLTCAETRMAFKETAAFRQVLNNALATKTVDVKGQGSAETTVKLGGPKTIAELNKANRAYHGQATA